MFCLQFFTQWEDSKLDSLPSGFITIANSHAFKSHNKPFELCKSLGLLIDFLIENSDFGSII